jgi:hypothetical protein
MAMDAKEIELRGKAIAKAMQENEPSASVLKLLNDLKTGVHATEELLRSTRIGVTINRVRSHKDPSVQRLATELVSKWRDEVKKQPKKGTPAKVAAATASASPAPPSAAQSPAPTQSKQKHSVDPDKRNYKTDKVKYQVTGSEARDNCVRLMYDGLAYMSSDRKLTPARIVCLYYTDTPQSPTTSSPLQKPSKPPPTPTPAASTKPTSSRSAPSSRTSKQNPTLVSASVCYPATSPPRSLSR